MGSSRPLRPATAETAAAPKQGRCPICSAPTEPALRPFCSRRCADVDLSRWLRGAYAIPVHDADDDEDGDADRPQPSDQGMRAVRDDDGGNDGRG